MAPRTKSLAERFPLKGGSITSEVEDKQREEIPGDRLLTREEVAYKLGISPRTVYDLEKRGELPPPVRLGGIWVRHPLSVIEAHIDNLKKIAKG